MHIALVSEHASPLATLGGVDAGGQNVHVAALAEGLARTGHAVVVYTRRDDPDLPNRLTTAAGYDVVHVAAGPARPVPKDQLLPLMTAFAVGLRRSFGWERPDLVHAHFWMSGLAAQAPARELGVPLAMTFHALGTVKRRLQGAADTSPRRRLAIERSLARTADRVIATCSDEVAELAVLGARPEQLSVVPCGVDTDLFTPDGPARAGRRQPYRLVSAGRLVPRKGVADVIGALSRLPDTELLIAGGQSGDAGTGSERERLEAIATDLGVAERVSFVGPNSRTDMPALLRSADVVVCAPWYEPFGIVPLEAMASGVPVVGTAVGGLLDTVIDGLTGRLVPPRSPQALAAALGPLLEAPEVRRAYGQAGRRRAVEQYAWARVTEETLTAYRAVLGGTAGLEERPPQLARPVDVR